jgi:serine/threonine protein kinase
VGWVTIGCRKRFGTLRMRPMRPPHAPLAAFGGPSAVPGSPARGWSAAVPGEAEDQDLDLFGTLQDIDDKATYRLTTTGSPIGTHPYMSPEQARGGRITPQTDLSSGRTAPHMRQGNPREHAGWFKAVPHACRQRPRGVLSPRRKPLRFVRRRGAVRVLREHGHRRCRAAARLSRADHSRPTHCGPPSGCFRPWLIIPAPSPRLAC